MRYMIKELENYEIQEVMNIWLATTISAHNFIPKEYWFSHYDIVRDEYIPASVTFIYKENDVIKGFVSILGEAFVGALFVLNEYQGKGIGSKLIAHCKSIYRELELGVYKDNVKAVKFYKKVGFKVLEEHRNECSGCYEYIMVWDMV